MLSSFMSYTIITFHRQDYPNPTYLRFHWSKWSGLEKYG